MLFLQNFILSRRLILSIHLILSCILFPGYSKAQISDNFSDGDLSTNPAWLGDSGKFTINPGKQLQLNGISATDTACLVTGNGLLVNTEWTFWVKLGFSPSTSNYIKVYLASDRTDLKGALNGYYIRIGESGSLDGIDLYRQSGKTSSKLIDGISGRAAKSNTVIRVKTVRDNSGNWTLYSDTLGGTGYVYEGTASDNSYSTCSFFGISCRYSSTNRTRFYIDDISVRIAVPDTLPPLIDSLKVRNDLALDVYFSEVPDSASSCNTANYIVNNGIAFPVTAVRDSLKPSLVHLIFNTPFTDNREYILSVSRVADLWQNSINMLNIPFTYRAPVIPRYGDVLINEIYADPAPPVGLPATEFIEIFSMKDKPLLLAGWKLTDGSSTATLPAATIYPGELVILCPVADTGAYRAYGKVIGLSSFPSLNNSGDNISLLTDSLLAIDRVNYKDSWYRDAVKKQGGWTLERISSGQKPCDAAHNWAASQNPSGGTPGTRNSLDGTYTEEPALELESAAALSDTLLLLRFNKEPDSLSASAGTSYLVSPGNIYPSMVFISGNTAALTLSRPLKPAIVYEVTVGALVHDCAGNPATANKVRFGVSELPGPSDIVINEVLFNPMPYGSDFVEICNRSAKILDLKDLRLANEEFFSDSAALEQLSDSSLLLFPGDIAALTENTAAVKEHYPYGHKRMLVKTGLPGMEDSRGTIVLLDRNRRKIDQLSYSESFHFPLISSSEGVSLERLNPERITQDSTNWHSAAESCGYATPGYQNSQYTGEIGEEDVFSIAPDVFSPDNDGYEDNLSISYRLGSPGMLASIIIYSDKGHHVRRLCSNELLASSGYISWNGLTDSNEKAAIGIYIIYAETIDGNGKVKRYKKSCVVGGKL